MAQSLDELKTSRASTKGSITRIKNLVDSRVLSTTELECRLGILESYFKQGLAYQTAIESHAPADTTGRSELEDLYVSTKEKILLLMGSERRNSSLDTTLSIPQIVGSHLPKLKLPRFDGKYSDYKNFINSFTKLVDSNVTLSKIEKFNHLLSCLQGAALSTVKAFQVTDENYEKALERLKERFDNDCLIFLENISQLFDLPKVQKSSAAQLRNLVNDVSALFSSLKSLAKWDEQFDYKTLPTWQKCSDLINKRCQYLEARESKTLRQEPRLIKTESKKSSFRPKYSAADTFRQTSLATMQRPCSFCGDNSHAISNCASFLQLSTMDRFTNVKNLGICINCLAKGHNVTKCFSAIRCKHCKKKHHSVLHRQGGETKVTGNETSQTGSSSATTNSAMEKDMLQSKAQVILATAIVLIKDASGGYQLGRVLLDSGSQVNFIKEEFARSLNLQKQKKNVDIIGIGSTETRISSLTQTTIRSRYSAFELSLEFLVAPSITGYQPDVTLDVTNWNIPKNIELADEQFNQPAAIDILLGAEAFFGLLLVGQIKLGPEMPLLQNTHLGWIVSGRYKQRSGNLRNNCCFSVSDDNLNEFVERFWELETVSGQKSKWTEEQTECEELFNKSIEELPSGRLMLKLPFKKDPETLGDSYGAAFRRFMSLERRLQKDSSLKSAYVDFLREYQTLGHMSLVRNPVLNEPHYYLPHQCVLRPNSSSTKLRVVFDASCRTATQVSLNSILMVGPTIQDDLFMILLRFRMHKYVLTADIVKMYRQILIHPSQRKYLYILWRESEESPIETYELNTVTYGTTSAPFMAIRCLKYLGDKYESQYKLGANVLRSDFYVDDMLTGSDDLNTLKQIQQEVWHPRDSNYPNGIVTIRLLCPIIVRAKTILQQLWIDKINWDAAIPQAIDTEWRQFMVDLNAVQNVKVPRYVLADTRKHLQIHGFCDASMKAYGCCLYVRTVNRTGDVTVKLLVAKSSSIKEEANSSSVFNHSGSETYFWSDSSVILHWISTHSSKLSTFVGNRVAEIQEKSKGITWRHVPTEFNPADIVSRGSSVEELRNSYWFAGPPFLLKPSNYWPTNPQNLLSSEELEMEKRKTILVCSQAPENNMVITINNCSSYIKIINIFAYILRYINQLKVWKSKNIQPLVRKQMLLEQLNKRKSENSSELSPLKIVELDNAFSNIVYLLQTQIFPEEIGQIQKKKELKNSLKYLNPFLDNSLGYPILKVGGRLTNAEIPEEEKHPILLSKESNFSLCYADYLHRTNYHAGPKSLVTLLRQKV
ncbi:uncharacterized protein LOC129945849 [Eupeodes corollae]|uniref:uncharacterized protein LOC129945849 n=1 Tax=Eupeodes corollae TaxID=290404 RepID=UPI002490A871|nr:uncharacterized protein LOC129945849 [Eupeodes corollae]